MQKVKLLYSGKAKSLYLSENNNILVAEFRDDITAFNGEKKEILEHKGVANNCLSAYLMERLEQAGIPTHFIERLSPCEVAVKKLTMIPIECVVRNIAAGSLCRRLGVQPGRVFDPPLYELFLKNDPLGDPLITEEHALRFEWATEEQLRNMHRLSLKINEVLKIIFNEAGLTLVDAKYEFGMSDGKMYVGDEISPDSCRIWDNTTQEILDKDRFRKGLGQVVESYTEIAQRLGLKLPLSTLECK